MVNTSIVASGQTFDIGCRVIRWDEPGGFSFYSSKKFTSRAATLDILRGEVKSFVLHHAACYTAKQTYGGLLARGLSVNFIIDDNVDKDGYATIYQCLDIKDAGWSHAPLNRRAPGVEIAYQPLAAKMVDAYSPTNQKKYGVQARAIETDVIHGQTLRIFPPAESQIKSCTALLYGFVRLFPEVKAEFPHDAAGNIPKTTISNPEQHVGFLSHFHITRAKIDPVGMPFDHVEWAVQQLIAKG